MRHTTNEPTNIIEHALNLFYVDDRNVMFRRGGTAPDYADVELCDFIRYFAKSSFPDVNLPESDDDLCEIMPELLLSGNDTDEGFLALFYMAAWAFAENREMLKAYEDTGLSPEVCAEYKKFEDECVEKGVTFRRIVELMSADVTPVVHGRWIGAPLCGNDNCRCSECGSWHNIHANLRGEPTQKYCPNCGAKMDGGDSDA